MKKEVAKYVKLLQQAQVLEAQERKHLKLMEKAHESLKKKLNKFVKNSSSEVEAVWGVLRLGVDAAYPEFGTTDWKGHSLELNTLLKNFDKNMVKAKKADAKTKADEKARIAKEKAEAKERAKHKDNEHSTYDEMGEADVQAESSEDAA